MAGHLTLLMIFKLLSIILVHVECGSEYGLHAFACNHRMIISEIAENAKDIVTRLNALLNFYSSDNRRVFKSEYCKIEYSGLIINSTISDEWMAAQVAHAERRNVELFVYIKWRNEFNVYHAFKMRSSDEKVSTRLIGCLFSNSTSNVDYTPISVVMFSLTAVINGRNRVEEDELCSLYFNTVRLNRKMYSPYHGYPVILVPGLVSSQIYQETSESSDKCGRIWNRVDSGMFAFLSAAVNVLRISTILECLKMKEGPDGKYTNANGLHSSASPFGHPDSVNDFYKATFPALTRELVSWGYVPGISLKAAPYDFRLAIDESSEFFEKLEKLIYEAYSLNNNRRIVLIGHSMGNLFIHHFLNQMTEPWKETYIKSFVSVAAPWGGSLMAWKFLVYGKFHKVVDMFSAIGAVDFKPFARTWPSLLFLLPRNITFNDTDILFTTPTRNYTVADQLQLLTDSGLHNLIQKYRIIDSMKSFAPPNVEVHCVYGDKLKTDLSYSTKSLQDTDFDTHYGDGDEVVLTESAKGCLKWKNQQAQPVLEKSFDYAPHDTIFEKRDLFKYVKEIVLN